MGDGNVARVFAQISGERFVQAQFLDQTTSVLLAWGWVQPDVLQVAADVATDYESKLID